MGALTASGSVSLPPQLRGDGDDYHYGLLVAPAGKEVEAASTGEASMRHWHKKYPPSYMLPNLSATTLSAIILSLGSSHSLQFPQAQTYSQSAHQHE